MVQAGEDEAETWNEERQERWIQEEKGQDLATEPSGREQARMTRFSGLQDAKARRPWCLGSHLDSHQGCTSRGSHQRTGACFLQTSKE